MDWMTWQGLLPGLNGALTADVVTAIDLEHRCEVTEHPIETGSKISDHALVAPAQIQIDFAQSELPNLSDETLLGGDCMWTQTLVPVQPNAFRPQGLLALQMAVGAAVKAIAGAAGLNQLRIWNLTATRPGEDRVHKLHDTIVGVLERADKVAFSYRGLVLSDYVLTSVKLSRSAEAVGLARLSLTARHILTVQTAASMIGKLPKPAILRALPLASLGKKTAKQVEREVVAHANLGIGLDLDL